MNYEDGNIETGFMSNGLRRRRRSRRLHRSGVAASIAGLGQAFLRFRADLNRPVRRKIYPETANRYGG